MVSRIAPAVLFSIAAAFAAPPLSTVQDVLYKADGTRFNGLLVVSWKSFEASDTSNISTQSLTVKVVEGILKLQLVPTTNASPSVYYSVKYNSDGRVQFEETWAVPASAVPLRVRDVRVPANLAGNDTLPLSTPIQQTDVIGLPADLSARPVKSAGYSAGRAVFVNLQGSLESVSGSFSDCVRVDGSSGPCGSATEVSFVDSETPAGLVDGGNQTFTIAGTPAPSSSLAMYRNGMLMKLGQDYTLAGRTVTFLTGAVPQPGDTLLAGYRLGGSATTGAIYPGAEVLCSGTGAATNSSTDSSLGICTIPGGLLQSGDRVEIRYALEHAGTGSGFHFDVKWGATTITARDGAASDALVTGRADAAIHGAGAQIGAQSWGGVLPFAASVAAAPDPAASGLTIEFLGRLSQGGGDTLTLTNFTVIRFP